MKKLALISLLTLSIFGASLKANAYTVTVQSGKTAIYNAGQVVTDVRILDNSVAAVRKLNNKRINIVGKLPGRTTIELKNRAGIGFDTVEVVVADSRMQDVSGVLRSYMPNEQVTLSKAGNNVVASGAVSSSENARKIAQIAANHGNVVNLMNVKGGQQVMLRVRVGEIQRTALKEIGINLTGQKNAGRVTFPFQTGSTPGIGASGAASFGTGSVVYNSDFFNLNATLDALESEGLFKVLAEPNLTAISGETANFLAGGEFPVPVQQDNNKAVTIDFKKFGVGVDFTPVVLAPNRIRLTVAPEVSELSNEGAVVTAGFSIPAISTRRARTTVELAPGESFMIAGLIKDNVRTGVNKVPGVGSIPILGSLFRNSTFERNETELVIAVTPYLVDPVTGSEIRLPTDDFRTPSQMEQVFLGSLGSTGSDDPKLQLQVPGSRLSGPFGYMTE